MVATMSSMPLNSQWIPVTHTFCACGQRKIASFLTKDHDIGALVDRDLRPHCGVLLVDDLGAAVAETALILAALSAHSAALIAGAFLRAGSGGIREARG
jgi:hypothetical protein